VPTAAARALEALSDLVVMADEEGLIAWANQAFLGFVGEVSVVGRPFEDFVAVEDIVSLVGFASVLGFHGATHNLLMNAKDGTAQCFVSTGTFEDDGATRVVLFGRPMADLQAEAAAQSRQAADEREKADALEIAHRELEAMHRELTQTQATLMRASRLAGMAEIASNVLHEVGNALNSVGIGSEILARRLDSSTVGKLRRTAELIRAEIGATASPRATKALHLLDLLLTGIDAELRAGVDEARSIQTNVEHVKTIVAAQQQHAKTTDVVERVPLAELVREVLMCHEQDMRRHGIELIADVDDSDCDLLRHKFVQILTNLLANAQEAVTVAERRVVLVRARAEGERIVVSVHDSGPGIPAGIFDRIFQHGFTTKPTKQGFGLHASANAAHQLGGRLTAADGGELGGATFTLDFPRCKRPGPFRRQTGTSLSTAGVDGNSDRERHL
jgi:signal transduction histidine kinase